MKDPIGDCLARYIDAFQLQGSSENWAVLVSSERLTMANKAAGLEMPKAARCIGRNWMFPSGGKITISTFDADPIPNLNQVLTCNDGKPFEPRDLDYLKKWRTKK